ncbi:hypothetical protein PILCRDRAFT_819360 [Piloderma croceum F 1598]|uniref:Uncharacterized protein n=1 Tax=Piloderma croceum (strain F 1598) TaxID=765440 RepID=A0A0C3FZR0_PILCF|nr:hypothetical protein PILCRDRAFT_819360 [Piloderma croceum F 1598]
MPTVQRRSSHGPNANNSDASSSTKRKCGTKEPSLDGHIFQTIFLAKHDSSRLWSKDDIHPDKVVLEKR